MLFLAYGMVYSPAVFAKSYNANQHIGSPRDYSRFCEAFFAIDQKNNCSLEHWRSIPNCLEGGWVDGPLSELSMADYVYDVVEKELQFTNVNNWPVDTVEIEYKKEKGRAIIYDVKLQSLGIQAGERALLYNLPTKAIYIQSVTVFAPKKPICKKYRIGKQLQ